MSDTTPELDPLTLAASGWERLKSGRWHHPEHTHGGRRKLYTEQAALAELAASQCAPATTTTPTRWPNDRVH